MSSDDDDETKVEIAIGGSRRRSRRNRSPERTREVMAAYRARERSRSPEPALEEEEEAEDEEEEAEAEDEEMEEEEEEEEEAKIAAPMVLAAPILPLVVQMVGPPAAPARPPVNIPAQVEFLSNFLEEGTWRGKAHEPVQVFTNGAFTYIHFDDTSAELTDLAENDYLLTLIPDYTAITDIVRTAWANQSGTDESRKIHHWAQYPLQKLASIFTQENTTDDYPLASILLYEKEGQYGALAGSVGKLDKGKYYIEFVGNFVAANNTDNTGANGFLQDRETFKWPTACTIQMFLNFEVMKRNRITKAYLENAAKIAGCLCYQIAARASNWTGYLLDQTDDEDNSTNHNDDFEVLATGRTIGDRNPDQFAKFVDAETCFTAQTFPTENVYFYFVAT